jgi:hypothetical protein
LDESRSDARRKLSSAPLPIDKNAIDGNNDDDSPAAAAADNKLAKPSNAAADNQKPRSMELRSSKGPNNDSGNNIHIEIYHCIYFFNEKNSIL